MKTKNCGISPSTIVRLTNEVLGTTFKSYKELESKMFLEKARLHGQWLKSRCADYSVYDDLQYIYEAIHCFEKTRSCTAGTIAYFKGQKQSNVSYDDTGRRLWTTRGDTFQKASAELEMIDVYNGNGLTTIHLALNGYNVQSFNTCIPQIEYMQHAARDLVGREITNYTVLPDKQYDVVLSFEVLEHYSDPIVHLEELIKLTKPGGYLAESTGFNGSSENIGHFETYKIGGIEVPFREARRITTRKMQEHFTLVYDGYNRMPKIWKLK